MLYHVVRSEHTEVCTLLKNNIDLLYGRGCVTDLSDRTFESISPFEFAIWSLNGRLWKDMLRCIPANKYNEVMVNLKTQYEGFKIDENGPEEKVETPQIKGVTYLLHGTSII